MPAITVTLTDAESDPPAVVVAVDGAGPFGTVLVTLCRVADGGQPVVIFQAAGLPSGTALSVAVPAGIYTAFGVNQDDPAGSSPVVMASVTNGADSTATRSRRAIADRIRLLALPVNVYEQWNAEDLSNVEYPCVILSVDNVRETAEKSFNSTDDIGRPVMVRIIDTVSKTDHTMLPQVEKWRERIERAFRGQQLPMPESVMCRVEYDSVVDPTLPPLDVLNSEFVIRHITREFRGL